LLQTEGWIADERFLAVRGGGRGGYRRLVRGGFEQRNEDRRSSCRNRANFGGGGRRFHGRDVCLKRGGGYFGFRQFGLAAGRDPLAAELAERAEIGALGGIHAAVEADEPGFGDGVSGGVLEELRQESAVAAALPIGINDGIDQVLLDGRTWEEVQVVSGGEFGKLGRILTRRISDSASMPVFRALRRQAARPAAEVGPVLFKAFLLFASIWAGEAMIVS
jgi:hypothetical protein